MPEIQPFRALRYSRGNDLAKVLAPPSDGISPALRARLAARDPHNCVNLFLPEAAPGRSKYQVAGELLSAWTEGQILARDDRPCIYLLGQVFEHQGRRYLRRGLLARLRLHPFADGEISPHESAPSEESIAGELELMKEVKANLVPVFGVFEDDPGEAQKLMANLTAGRPEVEVATDDGVKSRLWSIVDPAVIASLQSLLARRPIYVADGRERYEAALAYRDWVDSLVRTPDSASHKYLLAFLCPLLDPGLVTLPTHRLVHGPDRAGDPGLRQRLEKFFEVRPVPGALSEASNLTAALARLVESGARGPSFLLSVADHALSLLICLKPDFSVDSVASLPSSPVLRGLDAVVLNGLILSEVLGLSPESVSRGDNLRYSTNPDEVVRAVAAGEAQLGIFMNPTAPERIRAVMEAGEVMPKGSASIHPKLPSALLMNSVEPRELAY